MIYHIGIWWFGHSYLIISWSVYFMMPTRCFNVSPMYIPTCSHCIFPLSHHFPKIFPWFFPPKTIVCFSSPSFRCLWWPLAAAAAAPHRALHREGKISRLGKCGKSRQIRTSESFETSVWKWISFYKQVESDFPVAGLTARGCCHPFFGRFMGGQK